MPRGATLSGGYNVIIINYQGARISVLFCFSAEASCCYRPGLLFFTMLIKRLVYLRRL